MKRNLLSLAPLALLSLIACNSASPWVGTWTGETSDCDDEGASVSIVIAEGEEKGSGTVAVTTTLGVISKDGSAVTCQGETVDVDLSNEETLTFTYDLTCSNDQVVNYTVALNLDSEDTISGSIAYGSSNCQMSLTLEATE